MILQIDKSENLYDPLYRESIMRSPSGRGLFFAPEAVKRINKTLELILSSKELLRLNFITEDPSYSLVFPSAHFSVCNQLVGTLYLSNLCRSKVSIEGTMFYQWLLEMNLLEEYMVLLLIEFLIKLPFDKIINTKEYFENMPLADIINKCFKEVDILKKAKENLSDTLNTEVIIEIMTKEMNELQFEHRILKSFISGELNLSHIDRVFRLSYLTGKNYGFLNIDELFQSIEINRARKEENENALSFTVVNEETKKQIFRFYDCYHSILLNEVVYHLDISFYRGILKKSFAKFMEGIDKQEVYTKLLEMNDFELWHLLNSNKSSNYYLEKFRKKTLYKLGVSYKVNCEKNEINRKINSTCTKLAKKLNISIDEIVLDIMKPSISGRTWLCPTVFKDMIQFMSENKLQKISKLKEQYCFSFFTLTDSKIKNNSDFRTVVLESLKENGLIKSEKNEFIQKKD